MRTIAATLSVLLLTACGQAAAPATQPAHTDAQYAAHIAALKKSLPAGFTVLLEKPFVVIGDDTAAAVKTSAQNTVRWAVDHLKKEYFDQEPTDILDVYLFKDAASYDKYTKELFHDTPTTPYGYFSPDHKALIMNIATGGGTLVHEIVHPFVAANFPNCPTWFNEGLGSLYEQSAEKNGRIVGQTNWRLDGLQTAIRAEKVPAFKDLFALDSAAFYGDNRGTNYSASRYLLYYLQENGLLQTYYRTFLKNREKDPTGYDTLVATLNEQDMPAFQKRWQAWVMTLKFP